MLDAATGVHWLTFSTQVPLTEVRRVMGDSFGDADGPGAYGHPCSCGHESGARLYLGSPRRGQPLVVNVPGEVCDDWSQEALQWAEGCRGRVSRIDVACDVGPPCEARARLCGMYRAWLRGQVETRMDRRSVQLIKNHAPGEGWTAYYGGKCAGLRLRVYDRRGPLRIEAQWRPEGELGRLVPAVVREQGIAAAWRSLAASAAFKLPWYQQLLQGERVDWGSVQCEPTGFMDAVEAIRMQYGPTLWAMMQLGMRISDVAVRPGGRRRDLRAKLLRWASQAEALGHDARQLRAELSRVDA